MPGFCGHISEVLKKAVKHVQKIREGWEECQTWVSKVQKRAKNFVPALNLHFRHVQDIACI